MVTSPQTTPYSRYRICESRPPLFVLGGSADRLDLGLDHPVGNQRDHRDQAERRGVSPGRRRIVPLSLRFYSHVRPGLFKGHFDVVVATHKIIGLVFRTRVFKLKRDMQKRSRDASSSSTLRQNSMAEGIDETPTHSSATVCSGPSPTRASAAGDQDHSRTPGGGKCK